MKNLFVNSLRVRSRRSRRVTAFEIAKVENSAETDAISKKLELRFRLLQEFGVSMGERNPLLPSALNPQAVAFAFPREEEVYTTSPTNEEPLPLSDAPGATGPTPPSPHDPWAIRRAQILSPHTREESSSSDFSSDSVAPTKREFRRLAYLMQWPFAVALVGAALGGLVAWKRYFLFTEFALGGIAFLATEPVKEVLFELFTRETSTGEARLGLPTVFHSIVQEVSSSFLP